MDTLKEIIFIFGATAIFFFAIASARYNYTQETLSVNYLFFTFLAEAYAYLLLKIIKKYRK